MVRLFQLAMLGLLVASVLFYSAVWPDAPIELRDTRDYQRVALDLQDLEVGVLHNRTPGYPALLALTNSIQEPSRLLFHCQLIFHSVSVALAVMTLLLCGVGRLGWMLLLLVGLSPFSFAPATYATTECLTEITLWIGFLSLVLGLKSRRSYHRWLVVSGFAFGAAALARPTYQLVALVLSATLVLITIARCSSRRRVARAILTLLVTAITIIGGLAVFNGLKFGYYGLTPLFGYNLTTRTIHFIERLPDEHAAVRDVLILQRNKELTQPNGLNKYQMSVWPARRELRAATGLDHVELSRYLTQLNLQLIRSSPLEYLRAVAEASSNYWFPHVAPPSTFGSRTWKVWWSTAQLVLFGLFFAVLFLLTFSGLAFLYLRYQDWPDLEDPSEDSRLQIAVLLLAVTLIFYTMAVSTAFEVGNTRYRVPTDLFIVLVAAMGGTLLGRLDAWTSRVAATRRLADHPSSRK